MVWRCISASGVVNAVRKKMELLMQRSTSRFLTTMSYHLESVFIFHHDKDLKHTANVVTPWLNRTHAHTYKHSETLSVVDWPLLQMHTLWSTSLKEDLQSLCVTIEHSQMRHSIHTWIHTSYFTARKTILQMSTSKPEKILIIYAQFIKFNIINRILFSFKKLSVHTDV